MVEDRLTDGRRIAQLLASELTGSGDALAALSVTDADPDVEPTTDGALAYRVRAGTNAGDAIDGQDVADAPAAVAPDDPDAADAPAADVTEIAAVYVHPDRVRVEFNVAPDVAAEAGQAQDLRVRPKAVRPPRTIVFVEDGAQVKWVLPVFEAVLAAGESDA